MKLKERLPVKSLNGVVNIVKLIYQGISRLFSDNAEGAVVVSSAPCPRTYLLANRRAVEIETEKAMLISLSRYEKWKAGGPC